MSYGLTGLATTVVIAFCFVYSDELLPTWTKYSFDLINNARVNNSPMIETGAGSLLFRGKVGKQHETAPYVVLRPTSPIETGPSAIDSDSFHDARGPLEAFNG